MRCFHRHHGKDLAAKFRDSILLTCVLVLGADFRIGPRLVNLVGRKDAGVLAATRSLGLAFLVSTDSDLERVPEQRSPREFLAELDEVPFPGDE